MLASMRCHIVWHPASTENATAKIAMVSVDFEPIEQMQHAGNWEGTANMLSEAACSIEAAGAERLAQRNVGPNAHIYAALIFTLLGASPRVVPESQPPLGAPIQPPAAARAPTNNTAGPPWQTFSSSLGPMVCELP